MTHQMARGSQVAFCNSWLERQNIESQTVDVHSHIDGSLSYEENIKKMKRMLGMGGRSTQQATPTMTAGECDVAIGNYEAGYNGTTMKDACECGHPDACEELERKKAKPKKTTPKRKAAIERIELRTGRKYPRTKKELETHWGWSIEITRGTKTFLGESEPQVTIYAKGGIKRHPGIGTNTALAIRDFCNKNKIPTIAERTKAAARAVPPASPKKTEYTPAKTWEEFVRANDSQIHKHSAKIKEWAMGIKDKKRRETLFNKEIRQYRIDITDIWSKTKPKAKTTSATVDKFRKLLIKHPDRRVKTIERMRDLLISHTLGRDFGGSMEDYYKQRPDLKITDEGLKALISEAGRGTIKATPTPRLPPLTPPAAAPKSPDKMHDDLTAAITGGFSAKPKKGLVSQKEHELGKTLLQWGKGIHTPPPTAKPAKAPKPKPKAAKPTVAKTATVEKPKTTKKPAKPKAKKTAAAAPKLTATQAKRLAATGRITVKRGGKFVTITR